MLNVHQIHDRNRRMFLCVVLLLFWTCLSVAVIRWYERHQVRKLARDRLDALNHCILHTDMASYLQMHGNATNSGLDHP